MYRILPENLIRLARACPEPLYVVGGSVRDFLCGRLSEDAKSADWDICSPLDEETVIACAERCGFTVRAAYKQTGTVKLQDESGAEYEFTRFRSDRYVRGLHTPSEIFFTDDIRKDARRRDFCANAIYYDVNAHEFCDPLNGIDDVKRGILRTVAPAEKVFSEDGLRLMRLARIAAQTGFCPDEDCKKGAKLHAALIRDIAPERIFAELNALLHADEKHNLADAPYRGLHILHETGVLAQILPELTIGDGMAQRNDFHRYDVLEHSLRCVRYAPPAVRFAALLHDVGKPFCYLHDGNFHNHPEEGARLAREILTRLKAPKKLVSDTETLVLLHMRDFDLKMREYKIRKLILQFRPLFADLLALKQADYSACKDDLSEAPCVKKWKEIYQTMKAEGAPFSLADLAIDGTDAIRLGIAPQDVGATLRTLLDRCALDGLKNDRETLLSVLAKLARKKEDL